MFEYRGYEVEQTDHSIYMYQNGKFVLHASITGKMGEDELYETLDCLIDTCIRFRSKAAN